MAIEVRVLGPGDGALLASVEEDVFDEHVQPALAAEFLADPRHHLAVACDAGRVVGFASAVHYVHPDKPTELWINEVGVAPTHQGRGLGKRLLQALFEKGRELGCRTAWVLTNRSNEPAMGLYRSAGGVEGDDDIVMYEFSIEGF